jgi:hypothetical protein
MTAIEQGRRVRWGPQALGHPPATAGLRLIVRTLIALIVVLAVVASAAAATPATTFLLGGSAIAWLMLSFEAGRPR